MSDIEITPYLLLASVRDRARTVAEIADSILVLRRRNPGRIPFVLPWKMSIDDVLDVLEDRGWLEVTPANGSPARYRSSKRGVEVLGSLAPRLKDELGLDISGSQF